jgi:preprotein translocase subunit SecG
MLSFLREQGFDKLIPQKQARRPSGGQATNAGRADRGLSQDVQGQEYLTVAAQSKNVRRSTMMIAVLFCIGLLGLWFMIKKSQPQAAMASPTDAEETQIEVAIARLTGVSTEMFSRMDQIVQKFHEFSDVLQVKVNELVKNPFELEMFLSNLMGKIDPKEHELPVDPEIIRQQQIMQKTKDLKLASIMKSDRGKCCMIGGKILYEGDSIRELRVTQIGDTFVKLEWPGEGSSVSAPSQSVEIVLKLSE